HGDALDEPGRLARGPPPDDGAGRGAEGVRRHREGAAEARRPAREVRGGAPEGAARRGRRGDAAGKVCVGCARARFRVYFASSPSSHLTERTGTARSPSTFTSIFQPSFQPTFVPGRTSLFTFRNQNEALRRKPRLFRERHHPPRP